MVTNRLATDGPPHTTSEPSRPCTRDGGRPSTPEWTSSRQTNTRRWLPCFWRAGAANSPDRQELSELPSQASTSAGGTMSFEVPIFGTGVRVPAPTSADATLLRPREARERVVLPGLAPEASVPILWTPQFSRSAANQLR